MFSPYKNKFKVLQINEITFCKALSILYTNNCSTAPYGITTITLEVKMNVNKQPFPTVQLLRKPPFLDCSFHISPTCTFYNLWYHCCHAKSAVYTLKCCGREWDAGGSPLLQEKDNTVKCWKENIHERAIQNHGHWFGSLYLRLMALLWEPLKKKKRNYTWSLLC